MYHTFLGPVEVVAKIVKLPVLPGSAVPSPPDTSNRIHTATTVTLPHHSQRRNKHLTQITRGHQDFLNPTAHPHPFHLHNHPIQTLLNNISQPLQKRFTNTAQPLQKRFTKQNLIQTASTWGVPGHQTLS